MVCRNRITEAAEQAQQFLWTGLSFPLTKEDILHLVAFSNSSFAPNEDLCSHVGFLILLGDGSGTVCVMSFASRKSKRVGRSVLGSELFAFRGAVDEALHILHDLKMLLGRDVALKALTDSSLFSIIVRSSTATECGLMIDLQAARGAFQN